VPHWTPGAVIGARAKDYEAGSKVTSMHPGIVLDGPDAQGFYRVAMISNTVLGDDARARADEYAPGMDGDVDLTVLRRIHATKMRQWKRRGLGLVPPVTRASLAALKADINHAVGYALVRRRR